MASPAHCFYCFESLDASFERREPPKLERVLELYEKYSLHQAASTGHGSHDEETRGRSAQDVGEKEEEAEAEHEHEHEHAHATETAEDGQVATSTHTAATLRPSNPSISRLQSSSSSSRSSSASSPSTVSAQSSQSHLTPSTSTSSISSRPSYASRLSATENFPLFVTWNTLSRSGTKSLRGCIGTFEGMPLEAGLNSYALTSAFDDTRFSPIPASLLSALSCSLTLLADFEPCADAMDWTVGVHGLRISFTQRNRRYGATYLPDVAVEQGWTKEETLESLMKKAGWDGGYQTGAARRMLRGSSRGDNQHGGQPWEQVSDLRVVRYTGLKATADYRDWRAWRDWCLLQGESIS